MKRIIIFSKVLPLMVILAIIAACVSGPEQKVGKLVGYKASFGLDQATKNNIKDINFGGVLILELKDGSKVEAVVDKQLVPTLRGGDMLTIEAIEGSNENSQVKWKVIGLAQK